MSGRLAWRRVACTAVAGCGLAGQLACSSVCCCIANTQRAPPTSAAHCHPCASAPPACRLPAEVRRAAAAEMARVLKPGGICILTDSSQLGDRDAYDATLG